MARFRSVMFQPAAAGLAALVLILTPRAATASVPYESAIHDANRLHLTISNFGTLGNDFSSRSASLEYPYGTGYEHLIRGGLWVGAQATDGNGPFTGVVTAALDQATGANPTTLSEFTPTSGIVLRSNNAASPYFSALAVSELDATASFDDQTVKYAAGSSEPNRPMGLAIRQEIHAWSAYSLQDMVFAHYVVRALQPLANVWLGIYTELASGPKSSYVYWPPSSVDPSGLGSWYMKKWMVYEDSLRLLREHYCAGQPVPAGCLLSRVPPWVGVKLLTPPAPGQQRTIAAWSWSPGDASRDQDVERYGLMSAGTVVDFADASLAPGTGDPVELVALGPFAGLATGDSVEFDVVLLGGPDEESLRDRARLAQRVHDVGYVDAYTPAQASLVSQLATFDAVRLTWWVPAGSARPETVQRREAAGDWRDLGPPAADGPERWRFDDLSVRPTARYAYRLRLAGGATTSETEIVVPAPPSFGLRLAAANPSAPGAVSLRVSLDTGGPARLEVFDVGGRRILGHDLGSASRTERTILVDPGLRLAPGVYLARLRQGTRAASVRFVVVD